MNNLHLNKIKWLFAAMLLSCACCNAQPSHVNAEICVHCDSIASQCDSNVTHNDSIALLCDSVVTHRDSIGQLCDSTMMKSDSTIVINAINDSIADIISNSKIIICELQTLNPQDTTRTEKRKMLPRKLNEVFKFIISDSDNYKSNDIVYGLFSSSIRYKLCQARKKYVYAEFDFGLRKWQLLDSNEEVLFQGDIKENNLQMLRFSRIIFPEDKTLKIIQNNLKSL